MLKKCFLLSLFSICIICFVLFASIDPLQAKSNYNQFYFPDGFFISLPSDWTKISQEQFQNTHEALSKLAPNYKQEKYNYGFQLKSVKTNYMQYPNILIQIQNKGKISKKELIKMNSVDDLSISNKVSKSTNNLISNIDFGKKFIYDPKNKLIWLKLKATMQNAGNICGLGGFRLTRTGLINIYCYATEEQYPHYQLTFENIIKSVTPVKKDEYYEDSWTDIFDWERMVGKGIAGGLSFGIIAFFAWLFKRKKPKTSYLPGEEEYLNKQTKNDNDK